MKKICSLLFHHPVKSFKRFHEPLSCGTFQASYARFRQSQRRTRILFFTSLVFLGIAIFLTTTYFPSQNIRNVRAASTYYVNVNTGSNTNSGSQSSPWKTITYAVSQATTGDTISVAAGTYNAASGETFPISITQNNLTLTGAGSSATIISNLNNHAFSFNGVNGGRIEGFHFQNMANNVAGVDFINSPSNITITNNRFTSSNLGSALSLNGGGSNITFSSNIVSGMEWAIVLDTQILSGITINNNIFYNTADDCLYIADSSNVTIVNNTFYQCGGTGITIGIQTGNNIIIKNNIIYNSVDGDLGFTGTNSANITNSFNLVTNLTTSYKSLATIGTGEFNTDPLFTDPNNGNFILQATSPAIDAGDPTSTYATEPSPNGNRIDLGAYGNTSSATTSTNLANIYVNAASGNDTTGDGTSSSPYLTITKALTRVRTFEGDIIHVTSGSTNTEFTEQITLTRAHMGNASNRTTIQAWSGQNAPIINASSNSYGFNISGIDYITLSGFTIKNATFNGIYAQNGSDNITISNATLRNNTGNGIEFSSSTYGTVSNSTIYSNTQDGIRFTSSSNGTVSDSTIYSNTSDGIELNNSDNTTISRSTVYGNTSHGLYLQGGSDNVTITSSTIRNNGGRGVDVASSGNTTVSNSNIYSNTDNGIRLTSSTGGTISGNTLYDYTNATGIAILTSSNNSTLTNNVIYNITGAPGISFTNSSSPTIKNNTLHNIQYSAISFSDTNSAPTISITNNILSIPNGAGYWGLEFGGSISQATNITSNYNNFYLTGSNAAVGYFGSLYSTLPTWQTGTGKDSSSISSSPLFLSTTLGSEDFHLQSGSPSIDLGDPSDSYSNETQPNGSRINQGAYGNIATVEVSSVSGLGAGGGVTDNTPPDAISDLSSVSSTINSLTLSWTDTGDDGSSNGSVQAYEIRYSLNPITPENFSSAVIYQYASSELFPKTPGTTNQLTINGLLEDTTYSVAIKSVDNNVNWSSISNIITVKTASSVPIQQTTAAQEQTPTTEQTQSTTQEQSPTQPTTPTEQTPTQEPTTQPSTENNQQTTNNSQPSTAEQEQTPAPEPTSPTEQPPTDNSQPSTTEQEQTLTTEEPASPTSPTQTTTGDVSQSSSTPSPTTLSLTFKKPSEGEQGYINKKQPTVVCKTKPVQKNHSVVFSVDNKVDKTVSTNKEGICEFTPSSELSEGKHVIKAEMQLNTKIIGKSIEFIVDTKKPGIPVIGEMTFQKFKKINDEETETEITISGANITEDLSAFVICIAPLQKNILILKKVVKLELPADDLHPEPKTRWLKTITRRIPVGDIALWNWVEDKAGNISGTPCEDEPEEPEVISGFGPDTTTITFSYPACSDLFDNDWDGYMDYPNDKECSSSSDETEDIVEQELTPPSQCNDKLDNDMDNNIDLSDMGCSSYEDDNEADELTGSGGYATTECFDTIDNDSDSVSDYPNDTGCREKYDPTEGADSTPPDAPVVSQIKATAITPTDTVNTYKVTISAHGVKSDDSKTITLIIESNPFEVTFTPEIQSLSWNYDITIALEVGEHRVYAYATDYDGNRSSQSNTIEFDILQQGVVEIQEPEETLVETIISTITDNKVVSAIAQIPAVKAVIDNVIENPKVEKMNETVVAPVITAVVIANTAAAVGTGFNILAYLQYLITSPILLLARKKRKSWGVVYNTLTKQPVDLAIVRLYETGTNILLQTRVTDREGRYQFIVGPGKYYLTVSKPGFLFPTTYLRYKKEDISFVDLYHGDTINSTSKQGTIGVNIPLDPAEKKEEPTKRVIFNQLFRSFQRIIGFSGVLLALVSFIISPIPLLLGLLVLQILLYLVFRRFAAPKKPKSWGIVYDAKTKQPISRAIVRIYDVEFHKLLETQITDSQGRYAFLVGRNVYYVAVEKYGYEKKQTDPIDLRDENAIRAINKDIKLIKEKYGQQNSSY